MPALCNRCICGLPAAETEDESELETDDCTIERCNALDTHQFSSRTMAGSMICASSKRPEDYLYFFSSHENMIDDTSPKTAKVTANGVDDGFVEIKYEEDHPKQENGVGILRLADHSTADLNTDISATEGGIESNTEQ